MGSLARRQEDSILFCFKGMLNIVCRPPFSNLVSHNKKYKFGHTSPNGKTFWSPTSSFWTPPKKPVFPDGILVENITSKILCGKKEFSYFDWNPDSKLDGKATFFQPSSVAPCLFLQLSHQDERPHYSPRPPHTPVIMPLQTVARRRVCFATFGVKELWMRRSW